MIRFAVAVYRLLLRFWPGPFRNQYGAEATDLFAEMVREARQEQGWVAACGVMLRGWAGVLRGVGEEVVSEEAEDTLPRAIWKGLVLGLALDLKQAPQVLKRRPGTSLMVILTVAVAVGATTAVYTVIDGVLLSPLPYRESGRLVRAWQTYDAWADSPNTVLRSLAGGYGPSAPAFFEWSRGDTGFESIGAYRDVSLTLQGPSGAEVVRAQRATSGLFQTLDVSPVLGRALNTADDAAGAERVALISEDLWRSRYDRQGDVLGSELRLDGRTHVVVGVMPAGFEAPAEKVSDTALPPGAPQIWTSLSESTLRGGTSLSVIGRLAPGVRIEVASERLAAVHAQMVAAGLDDLGETGVRLESLLDSVVGDIRSTLWFLLGAVALVLAVATVNIANILTAWGLTRRRELALRVALGAGSGRLLQTLFVESAVLAALGGLGGIVFAFLSLPSLLRFVPPTVPRQESITADPGVLLFGIAVTGLAAVLIGTLPALLTGRADPQEALSSSSRSATAGRATGRIRGFLVASQVALAFVLLVGAALLGTSYTRLQAVERGFVTEGMAVMRVVPHITDFPTSEERLRFRSNLLERLGAIPGLRASAMNSVPLSGFGSSSPLYLERGAEGTVEVAGQIYVGLNGALEVLGVPLLSGRVFDSRDSTDGRPVVVVNQTMAQRFWPGESALGKRLRVINETEPREVVGVVADVRQELMTETEPAVFLPALQARRATNDWVLRVSGDPRQVLEQARAAVAALSPTTPVRMTLILDDAIDRSVAVPRIRTFLVIALASLAGALALCGVYGTLAFNVAQRTKEIGVRMTLGARIWDVTTQIVGSGLKLAAIGVAVGLPVAWAASGLVRSFLFEIVPTHGLTYAAVAAGVLAVSGLAAYMPARRAAAVDPVTVLKSD